MSKSNVCCRVDSKIMQRIFIGFLIAFTTFLAGIVAHNIFNLSGGTAVINHEFVAVELDEEQPEIREPFPDQNIEEAAYEDEYLREQKNLPFDPSGNYYPALDSRSELHVQIDIEVRKRGNKYIAWGSLIKESIFHKFSSVHVTKKTLEFKTNKINGIEYRFEGRFLGTGNFAGQADGRGNVMLEGTLQKYLNGEKIAEVTSPVLYYAGC